MSDYVCPGCGYKVGKPCDMLGRDFNPEKPSICFCVRCFFVMWIYPNKAPTPCSNQDFFRLIMMRPNETLHMIRVALVVHDALPTLEAGKN